MVRSIVDHKVTVAVDDVQPASAKLPEMAYKDAIMALLRHERAPLESWSQDAGPLIAITPQESGVHPFLATVHRAYADHRPLVLSPNMIWLLILQGLALHMNADAGRRSILSGLSPASRLRRRLVARQDKRLIDVRRDQFGKGFAGNDWEGVFAEFSAKIKEQIGEEVHGLIVQSFSTTGAVEKAAMEVALMDAFQSCFVYSVTSLCGIPAITLEGQTEDWVRLRAAAIGCERFDLKWWIPHLLAFLDHCVGASRGDANRSFWQEFYKLRGGSGGPYISGHIVNLFPYLGRKRSGNDRLLADLEVSLRQSPWRQYTDAEVERHLAEYKQALGQDTFAEDTLRRSPYLGGKNTGQFRGLTSGMVASTISRVPFIWNYYNTVYPMAFVAGFVGATQDSTTYALRPAIGWAVLDGKIAS